LLQKIGNVLTLGSSLLLVHGNIIPKSGNFALVFAILIFSLLDILGHHISISDEVEDVSLFALSLLSEILNLSSKCINTRLGDVLLLKSVVLLSGLSIFSLVKLNVAKIKLLVFFLNSLLLVDILTDCDLVLALFFVNLFVLSYEQLVLLLEVLIAVS